MKVLNVGSGAKGIPMPARYAGWEESRLDVDPRTGADIIADARDMPDEIEGKFDAVYCSHALEHFHRHDVRMVLAGFARVLRPDGFVHIRVPNIARVMREFLRRDLDIEQPLYQSPAGPISTHDVLYGYGKEIEESGSDWFAHKTGFTPPLMARMLRAAGFRSVEVLDVRDRLEVEASAYLKDGMFFGSSSINSSAAIAWGPPALKQSFCLQANPEA